MLRCGCGSSQDACGCQREMPSSGGRKQKETFVAQAVRWHKNSPSELETCLLPLSLPFVVPAAWQALPPPFL